MLMRDVASLELPPDFPLGGLTELRNIPVNSRTMRTFLVAVEDTLDHEWDIDTPEEVFHSFESLAAYLVAAHT